MRSVHLPLSILAFTALACGGVAEHPMEEPATGGRSGNTGGSSFWIPEPPEEQPECAQDSRYGGECRELHASHPPEEHCFTLEELEDRCNLARLIPSAEGGAGGAGPQAEPPGAWGGAAGGSGLACPQPEDLEWRSPPLQVLYGVCGSAPVERNGQCCYLALRYYLTI
jgi:hypothetical protein